MDCHRCEEPHDPECKPYCTTCYIELDLMTDWHTTRRFADGWWFRDPLDGGQAYGPYDTKAAAAADAAGLRRFHKRETE